MATPYKRDVIGNHDKGKPWVIRGRKVKVYLKHTGK